jgi:ABC-type branched-subunit amino acid transport system substrate-binding protein
LLWLSASSTALLAQEVIPVGRSLPLTGPLVVYGNAKKTGGDAYIERVNREGGVRGRKIRMTTVDDRYEPAETLKNIRSLNTAGVVAMLGIFGVPSVAAALPVVEELRLPSVGLTSGAAAVRTPVRRYSFPVRASYADEATTMAQHFTSLNLNRVVIVRQLNPFGNSVADTMIEALGKAGLKPVADIPFKIDGSDVKEVVARLGALEQVHVVFLAMQSVVAIPLLDNMRNANAQAGADVFSVSAVDTTALANALKEKARGVAISQIVPLTQSSLPLVREYLRDLKAIDGGAPSFYGLEGYVEARILVEGLRRAAPTISRENLVTALEGLGAFDLGGMVVTYGAGVRTGSRFVDLTMVSRNGTLVR